MAGLDRSLAGIAALTLACLPDSIHTSESATATDTGTDTDTGTTGEAPIDGLFGCERESCTFVVVSQTLDDRVDVFEVGAAPELRGRIDLDLKPDPSGLQTDGNLLDEPYGFVVTDDALRVLIGHYPDTERGSLVELPLALFNDVGAGAVAPISDFFTGVGFTGGARSIPLNRQEPIFALAHPSGRLLVGVFANNLQTSDWPTPGQLLVVDPEGEGEAAIGAVELGGLGKPCLGAWGLVALDDAVNQVALTCDGSDTVAVLTLPGDLGDRTPADGAAAITGCGASLLAGSWTTRSLAPDGAGGLLVVQSQLLEDPRLWTVSSTCGAAPTPAADSVAPEVAGLRLIHDVVLLRPAEGGTPATWLAAGGLPDGGVYIVQQAPTPRICGRVSGLDGVIASDNAPFALALAEGSTHMALGAGPPSNPATSEGRGQVLWAGLDLAAIGACSIAATEVVDLSAGRFVASDPRTWSRAPNLIRVIPRSGGAGS